MKYSEAKLGRVSTIRLEQGEIIHEALDQLAITEGINSGVLVLLGGLDNGSTLAEGPEDGQVRPIEIMTKGLAGVHKVLGVGTYPYYTYPLRQ